MAKGNRHDSESKVELKMPAVPEALRDLMTSHLDTDEAVRLIGSRLAKNYERIMRPLNQFIATAEAYRQVVDTFAQQSPEHTEQIAKLNEMWKGMRLSDKMNKLQKELGISPELAKSIFEQIVEDLKKIIGAGDTLHKIEAAKPASHPREGRNGKHVDKGPQIKTFEEAKVFFAQHEQQLKSAYLIAYDAVPPADDAAEEVQKKFIKSMFASMKGLERAQRIKDRIPEMTVDEARAELGAEKAATFTKLAPLMYEALKQKVDATFQDKHERNTAFTMARNKYLARAYDSAPFIEKDDVESAKKFMSDPSRLERLKKMYLINEDYKIPSDEILQDPAQKGKFVSFAGFRRVNIGRAQELVATLPRSFDLHGGYQKELMAYAKAHPDLPGIDAVLKPKKAEKNEGGETKKNKGRKNYKRELGLGQLIRTVETARAMADKQFLPPEAKLYGSMMAGKYFSDLKKDKEAFRAWQDKFEKEKAEKIAAAKEFFAKHLDDLKKNYLVGQNFSIEGKSDFSLIGLAARYEEELDLAEEFLTADPENFKLDARAARRAIKKLPAGVPDHPVNWVYYATLQEARGINLPEKEARMLAVMRRNKYIADRRAAQTQSEKVVLTSPEQVLENRKKAAVETITRFNDWLTKNPGKTKVKFFKNLEKLAAGPVGPLFATATFCIEMMKGSPERVAIARSEEMSARYTKNANAGNESAPSPTPEKTVEVDAMVHVAKVENENEALAATDTDGAKLTTSSSAALADMPRVRVSFSDADRVENLSIQNFGNFDTKTHTFHFAEGAGSYNFEDKLKDVFAVQESATFQTESKMFGVRFTLKSLDRPDEEPLQIGFIVSKLVLFGETHVKVTLLTYDGGLSSSESNLTPQKLTEFFDNNFVPYAKQARDLRRLDERLTALSIERTGATETKLLAETAASGESSAEEAARDEKLFESAEVQAAEREGKQVAEGEEDTGDEVVEDQPDDTSVSDEGLDEEAQSEPESGVEPESSPVSEEATNTHKVDASTAPTKEELKALIYGWKIENGAEVRAVDQAIAAMIDPTHEEEARIKKARTALTGKLDSDNAQMIRAYVSEQPPRPGVKLDTQKLIDIINEVLG